jgi:hypothetical protein
LLKIASGLVSPSAARREHPSSSRERAPEIDLRDRRQLKRKRTKQNHERSACLSKAHHLARVEEARGTRKREREVWNGAGGTVDLKKISTGARAAHSLSPARRRAHRLRYFARPSAKMVRKKVDDRVRTLIENGIASRTRSLLVLVGDRGKDQVPNLHYILTKAQVKARPSVLWCYSKELGFSTCVGDSAIGNGGRSFCGRHGCARVPAGEQSHWAALRESLLFFSGKLCNFMLENGPKPCVGCARASVKRARGAAAAAAARDGIGPPSAGL